MLKLTMLLLLALCTLWNVCGFVAVLRATLRAQRSSKQRRESWPGVSVLKPLCGADAGLPENLASFFEQDYPNFELIFGVEGEHDPAIDVVRELAQRYPAVQCKLVVHAGGTGINPKVRNLRGIQPSATHALLVVSDSNVRAAPIYLREMVESLLEDQRTGLVTSLFAGHGEDTLGAALENVQLNGFCAAGTTLPTLLGDSLVVGKSMLFRRADFERIGGFERVANVLAEDFVIGKMFQHAGYGVRIAPGVLRNVTKSMSVGAFFARHLRWSMMRWHLRPLAYALEPLTSPLALLPLALGLFGPWAFAWLFAVLLLRDVGGWVAMRGVGRAWIPLLLGPLRELSMLLIWLVAPTKRHVIWRGHKVRLGAGTLLFEARAA